MLEVLCEWRNEIRENGTSGLHIISIDESEKITYNFHIATKRLGKKLLRENQKKVDAVKVTLRPDHCLISIGVAVNGAVRNNLIVMNHDDFIRDDTGKCMIEKTLSHYSIRESCAQCKKQHYETQLKTCTGCNFYRFCSLACQRAYWPIHKDWCKFRQSQRQSCCHEKNP